MTPDDFKFNLLEHAFALYHGAMARTAALELDPKTSSWLVTTEAWREFQIDDNTKRATLVADFAKRERRLMGLPVRLTIDDEPGTPPVQLVMEPMLRPLR